MPGASAEHVMSYALYEARSDESMHYWKSFPANGANRSLGAEVDYGIATTDPVSD